MHICEEKHQQLLAKMSSSLDENRNELKKWQFKLYKNYNFYEYSDYDLQSLHRTLSSNNLEAVDNSIISAISPEKNCFLIFIKIFEGELFWNKDRQMLYHQFNYGIEPIIFDQDNWNTQIYNNARFFKRLNSLGDIPSRILFIYPAWIRMLSKKRLKRGILLSEPAYIINNLLKRNCQINKRTLEQNKPRLHVGNGKLDK